MKKLAPLLVLASFVLGASSSLAASGQFSRSTDWEIASTPKTVTWVEIHPEIKSDAWIHVEVLQQKKGAPPWEVQHLRAHVAITEEALRRSVIRPIKRGSVYPESFEAGYREWQTKSPPDICTTRLQDYLKMR